MFVLRALGVEVLRFRTFKVPGSVQGALNTVRKRRGHAPEEGAGQS